MLAEASFDVVVEPIGQSPHNERQGPLVETVVAYAVTASSAVARTLGGQELLDRLRAAATHFREGRDAPVTVVVEEPDTILPTRNPLER